LNFNERNEQALIIDECHLASFQHSRQLFISANETKSSQDMFISEIIRNFQINELISWFLSLKIQKISFIL